MTDGDAVGQHPRKYAMLLALLCIALAIETVHAQGGARFLSDIFDVLVSQCGWSCSSARASGSRWPQSSLRPRRSIGGVTWPQRASTTRYRSRSRRRWRCSSGARSA